MFGNYEKQSHRTGDTRPFTVTELRNEDGSHPILRVEHLGPTNSTLLEMQLSEAGAEKQKAMTNAEYFARHCVRGMERVYRADGSEATLDDAAAFLAAMPARAFARLAAFVRDEANFCEYPIATPPDKLAEK